MYWNARGALHRKKTELLSFTITNNIQICLINETHLRTRDKFTLRGFTVYRNDRIMPNDVPQGGTAACVRHKIQHASVKLPPFQRLEACAISIPLQGSHTTIAAVYNPPDGINLDDIDRLMHFRDKIIIAGDLNSKHFTWNALKNNSNGNKLYRHTIRRNYIIVGPNEPTHIPDDRRKKPDILDIVIHKGTAQVISLQVIHDLDSNHLPVIIQLNNMSACDRSARQPMFNYSKGNWELFSETLDSYIPANPAINNQNEIDAGVNTITMAIQNAIEASIPRHTMRQHISDITPEIQRIINIKNRLTRHYTRTHNPYIKPVINRYKEHIAELIKTQISNRWGHTLAKLNTHSNNINTRPVWPLARHFTREKHIIPALQGPVGLCYSAEEKSELMADTLESSFTPNIDPSDPDFIRETDARVAAFLTQPVINAPKLTNVHEIKWIIAHTTSNKAPGPDQIQNITLKHLTPKALTYLTNIINAVISMQHYPDSWKKAKIIVFNKPGKDKTQPQNYRPISLLNSLSKILEKVILKRLVTQTKKLHIPRHEQFGFRNQHSTTQQLLRLVENVTKGFNGGATTGTVFLDIEKAFDRVWYNGLLTKMLDAGLPDGYVRLIAAYLRGRTFVVTILNALSSARQIRAGVPQGSLLGPLLFNLYINDIPININTKAFIYADDTAISARSPRINQVTSRLQHGLQTLEPWLTRWRVKVNVNKCVALLNTHKRKETFQYRQLRPLRLLGQQINWTPTVKYLGVTLDQKLTWRDHIKQTQKKANARLGQLYPILNRQSRISQPVAIQMYKTLIRPIITYAAPVWGYTCKTNIKKLQVLQNKMLRIATKAPPRTRTTHTHHVSNTPMLGEHIWQLAKNVYKTSASNTLNPLVRQIGEYDPTRYTKHPTPKTMLENLNPV